MFVELPIQYYLLQIASYIFHIYYRIFINYADLQHNEDCTPAVLCYAEGSNAGNTWQYYKMEPSIQRLRFPFWFPRFEACYLCDSYWQNMVHILIHIHDHTCNLKLLVFVGVTITTPTLEDALASAVSNETDFDWVSWILKDSLPKGGGQTLFFF